MLQIIQKVHVRKIFQAVCEYPKTVSNYKEPSDVNAAWNAQNAHFKDAPNFAALKATRKNKLELFQNFRDQGNVGKNIKKYLEKFYD